MIWGYIVVGIVCFLAGVLVTWLYAKKAVAAAEAKLGQLGGGLSAAAKRL